METCASGTRRGPWNSQFAQTIAAEGYCRYAINRALTSGLIQPSWVCHAAISGRRKVYNKHPGAVRLRPTTSLGAPSASYDELQTFTGIKIGEFSDPSGHNSAPQSKN